MKKNKYPIPSSRERRVDYIILAVLLVIAFFAINYIVTKNKKEASLLKIESQEVVCRVIGYWHTSLYGNIFEYSVSGKIYKTHKSNYTRFRIGENFKGKYAKSKPEVIEIDLTSPVINNQDNFNVILAKVQKINSSSIPNIVLFTYYFNGCEYERSVCVDNADVYRNGDSCLILVKKEDPRIAYLKSQVNIK